MVLSKGKNDNIKTVNVDGAIASMEFEDMPVSSEMKNYAKERILNKTSYKTQIKRIKQKYGVNGYNENEDI